MYKKITKITLIMFMLSSCSNTVDSVKKGLTGAKSNSADEFLIKKKDPLILPPEFDKVPAPDTLSKKKIDSEEKFKDILKKQKKTNVKNKQPSSTEESVLKKITK